MNDINLTEILGIITKYVLPIDMYPESWTHVMN